VRLCWYRARLSRLRATAPTSTKGSILRESSLRKGNSPNFLELRQGEVRRRLQPVEKVMVGPVGGPREPENEAETLRKRRI
jgi:hypothetical protein